MLKLFIELNKARQDKILFNFTCDWHLTGMLATRTLKEYNEFTGDFEDIELIAFCRGTQSDLTH
jgi:hypothetical protein